MKSSHILFFTIAVCLIANMDSLAQNKTYFISPSGDDNNSGLTIENPWRTIDKVNHHVFQPGDVIRFKTGGIWHGQLHPQGSGEKDNPITLQSYGKGKMPVIDMGDTEGAAIRLVNQSWWEIRDLEVTSGAQPTLGIGRQGIVAIASGHGNQIEHILIEDNFIHDIWGQLDGQTMYTGYNSAAIYVGSAFNDPARDSTNIADDVLIRNNRIERIDKAGIIVFDGRDDVIVRANTLENLGGDGIFVNGTNKGLIEHNVVRRSCLRSGDPDLKGSEDWWPHTAAIWIQNAYKTIMQFNEVYDTGRQPGNGDGFAFDFDFDCRQCVLQYNYSKNNHGLLLIMNGTYNNIARYNISHNDQSHLIQLHGNIEDGNIIHNNLFYVDHSTVDIDYYLGDNPEDGNKQELGATFKNNIFYAYGQGRFNTVYSYGSSWNRQYIDSLDISKPFSNNLYFGPWLKGLPDDPEKVVADPLFMAPGTGGVGFSSLDGYMLRRESPAINAGTSVPVNVSKDFYGNPVNDGTPDIGVYEQVGSKVQDE